MSFDNLWAGWRASYVASVSDHPTPGSAPGSVAVVNEVVDDPDACVFCAIAASDAPDEELGVVHRGATTFAVLNAYPYASGHLLVMPCRHVGEIADVREDEYVELFAETRAAIAALERAYAPDGLNMGANFGRAAGAGIPRHLHVHVLPRWLGDTNFMTTVAATRVMPEALSDSWRKIREAWPD